MAAINFAVVITGNGCINYFMYTVTRDLLFIITVGIADLNDVITSLEKNNFPNDEWDDLGLKLGLIETKLRSIRADNRDVKGCLKACLRLWLEQDYNREKYDKPTMMSLKNAVEAMGQRAVALGILNEGGEFQPSLEIKKSLRSGSKGIDLSVIMFMHFKLC